MNEKIVSGTLKSEVEFTGTLAEAVNLKLNKKLAYPECKVICLRSGENRFKIMAVD